jgi:hypothetical protein
MSEDDIKMCKEYLKNMQEQNKAKRTEELHKGLLEIAKYKDAKSIKKYLYRRLRGYFDNTLEWDEFETSSWKWDIVCEEAWISTGYYKGEIEDFVSMCEAPDSFVLCVKNGDLTIVSRNFEKFSARIESRSYREGITAYIDSKGAESGKGRDLEVKIFNGVTFPNVAQLDDWLGF